ncbi:MAG: hypothetical protein KDH20_10995, partial [Rhodocyclaceae bacterium]|nr:hypothetical protein [Rhodocyclaceae bacterium]
LVAELHDSAKRISAAVGGRLRDLELPKLNGQWSSLADAPKRQILRDVAATAAVAQHLGPVRVEFVPASSLPKGVLARVTSSLVTDGERGVRIKYNRTVQITDRFADLEKKNPLPDHAGAHRGPMANAISTVIEEVAHIRQQKMADDFLAGNMPADAKAARLAKWYVLNHAAYQRSGGVDRFHYGRQPMEEQAKTIARLVVNRMFDKEKAR